MFFKKNKDNIIYAPVNCIVHNLKNADDKAFASGMIGQGVAIEPLEGDFVSPISGVVNMVFPTGHVVGVLDKKNRLEIIMSLGYGTDELLGEGFEVLTKPHVSASKNKILIKVDIEKVSQQRSILSPIVITNDSLGNRKIKILVSPNSEVKKGEPLFKVI